MRSVEVVTLVREVRGFGQDSKTVRKSTGYKQLSLVFCGKFNGYVLAVCRGTCADVNSYIQNATGQLANPKQISVCKKEIARIQTIIREQELNG